MKYSGKFDATARNLIYAFKVKEGSFVSCKPDNLTETFIE